MQLVMTANIFFLTLYMYLQCVDLKSEPSDSVWGIGGHYLNWTPQERQTPLLPSITESVLLTVLRCQYVAIVLSNEVFMCEYCVLTLHSLSSVL